MADLRGLSWLQRVAVGVGENSVGMGEFWLCRSAALGKGASIRPVPGSVLQTAPQTQCCAQCCGAHSAVAVKPRPLEEDLAASAPAPKAPLHLPCLALPGSAKPFPSLNLMLLR